MTNGIIDDVADAITRLRFLEQKSRDDNAMLALLVRQKDEMSQALADAEHNHSVELFRLQQERDNAVSRAKDVEDIITKIGEQAVAGITRIRQDGSFEGQRAPAPPAPQIVKPQTEQRTSDKLAPPSFSDPFVPARTVPRMPISASDMRLPAHRGSN